MPKKSRLRRKGSFFRWRPRAAVAEDRLERLIIKLRTEDMLDSAEDIARQVGVPVHVVERAIHPDHQARVRDTMNYHFERNED